MTEEPIRLEQQIDAPVEVVWKALTDKDEMKRWFVDIETFEAVPGNTFQFISGPENGKKYLHLCTIKEVIPHQKISYSWRYDDFGGDSLVTFSLIGKKNSTHVTLMHEGVINFKTSSEAFSRENFVTGWKALLQNNLKNHFHPQT